MPSHPAPHWPNFSNPLSSVYPRGGSSTDALSCLIGAGGGKVDRDRTANRLDKVSNRSFMEHVTPRRRVGRGSSLSGQQVEPLPFLSRKVSPIQAEASKQCIASLKDPLVSLASLGVPRISLELKDNCGLLSNTSHSEGDLGLRGRSVSFLDGFGASLERSAEFGMEKPSPSSMYRHLYAREKGFSSVGESPSTTREPEQIFPLHKVHAKEGHSPRGIEAASSHSGASASSDPAYEQAQILLVSLLENFCALYDRNPDKNRRLFMAVCRQLWNMGILTSADFFSRSEKLRGVYKEAFRTLVLQAIQGIEASDGNPSRLITSAEGDSEAEIVFEEEDATAASLQSSLHDITQSFETSVSVLNNSADSLLFPNSAFDVRPVRSRLETEFRDLVPIGRGGFAQVFRGEHRIDFCRYAFKRIEFKSKTSESYEKIMREIKSLAHLEHPYIVRYHGAWIEEKPREERSHCRRHSSHDVSNSFPASHGPPSQNISSPSVVTASAKGIAIPIVNPNIEFEQQVLVSPGYYMIIQMELCQFTLADWLEQRNHLISQSRPWGPECVARQHRSPRMCIPVERMAALVATQTWDINPGENCRIFKCIVKALQHIHAKGIIHRDLKPGNILFQIDDSGHYIPKIGDFGLASEMALSTSESSSLSELAPPSSSLEGRRFLGRSPMASPCSISYSARTTGLGTCMYAAPEQIRDSSYNEKVDIYSLGIILFELFYPFSTRMERHNVLEDLKNGIIPATFMKTWPKEATFIWSCISRNPEARPSAEQILESEILEQDPEETIERLSMENDALKRLLDAERERVRKLEAQVAHQPSGTSTDLDITDIAVDITNIVVDSTQFSLQDVSRKGGSPREFPSLAAKRS